MTAPTKNVVDLPVASTVVEADKVLLVDVSDTTEGPAGTVKVSEISTVGQVFSPYISQAENAADQAAASAAAAAEIVNISEVQTFTNPLARAVRVAMTAAASGSNGIRVASNANANFGTGNFTLHWEGALPDYTPSSLNRIVYKFQDSSNRYGLNLDTDGFLSVSAIVGGSTIILALATVVTGLTGGASTKISAVVTRETASSAGSVVFYINGSQLGSSVTIAAASPVSYDNTGILYLNGSSTERFSCDFGQAILYNRALSASEVLSLAVNGPALADIGASQTALYTSDFSAGVNGWVASALCAVAGNIDGIDGSDDWLRVTRSSGTGLLGAEAPSAFYGRSSGRLRISIELFNPLGSTITHLGFASAVVSVPAGTRQTLSAEASVVANQALAARDASGTLTNHAAGQLFYVRTTTSFQIGITAQYNAQDAQSDTGQVLDSSGNKNHALLPASGATVVGAQPSRQRQARSRHAWVTTSELQYWSGVNQDILPAGAAMQYIDIFSDASLSVNIGNGTTATFYASAVALTAGWNRITLAGFYAGTTVATRKLTITPTASATAVLNCTATYHTTETA